MQTSRKNRQKNHKVGLAQVGLWLLCLALASPMAALSSNSDSGSEGRALAQKVYDRPHAADASSQLVMTLQGPGKQPRERVLYSYAIDRGNSERWTLLRFIKPNDIEGTGLLTLDYKGEKSDQWLFLPALDRVRRIASSRKGGHFVGSDFYYEDLMDREVEMDHHRLLGKEAIGGAECDILESIPVDPDNSVYGKRVSWIHPEMLLPLRVDFYDKDGDTVIKQLHAGQISQVQGYWTVFDSTMVTLKTGHKTQLLTTAILYDQGLPEALFSQQGLAEETREKAFRPPAPEK